MAKKEKTASKGSGISKKQGQFICIIILALAVAAYIYLGVMYTNETKDQDKLNNQIDQREPILLKLQDRSPEKLDDLLEEMKANLANQEERIPSDMDHTDVQEILLNVADKTGVNILPLGKVAQVSKIKISGQQYNMVKFTLTPRGSYNQVIDFVNELENGESVLVNGRNISMLTSTIESLSLSGKGNEWSAKLSGAYYSRATVD